MHPRWTRLPRAFLKPVGENRTQQLTKNKPTTNFQLQGPPLQDLGGITPRGSVRKALPWTYQGIGHRRLVLSDPGFVSTTTDVEVATGPALPPPVLGPP